MGSKCEGNCDGGGGACNMLSPWWYILSYILYSLQCHQSMSTR